MGGLKHNVADYCSRIYQYRSMIYTLVKDDFKGRFRYTVLGYFWHLLNPLSQIVVYYILFTVIFGKDIPNYWAYVSTGMFLYVMVSTTIAGGCNSITGNKNLVTKLAFPREILVISKALTNLLTLSISYCILLLIMILFGYPVTWCVIFLPIVVLLSLIFSIGVAFMTSALTVYLRDVSTAVGIVMGYLMFSVPIIYLASQRSTPLMDIVWHVNPMFYQIECVHDCFYYGVMPNAFYLLMVFLSSFITLVIGWIVFKKLEPKFAEKL